MTQAVEPLVDEIDRLSKQLAADDAVDEALFLTTKKGAPYEESVVAALQPWARATGAGVAHVGGDNRPGDVVVEFGDLVLSEAAPKLVIEARDRTTPLGRKAIAAALDEALAERGGTAAIYLSRTGAGLAKEIGDWGEGTCARGCWVATTHEHLFIAIRFLLAQHRIAVVQQSSPEVDYVAIEAQVTRARTTLKRITNINRNVGVIREQAGSIQDEGESLRSGSGMHCSSSRRRLDRRPLEGSRDVPLNARRTPERSEHAESVFRSAMRLIGRKPAWLCEIWRIPSSSVLRRLQAPRGFASGSVIWFDPERAA